MKLVIDIPDNELKVPLRNIHLLISNEIVTEVCIKKYDYDKDEPYFTNLNYAPLEECDDCISREDALQALCKAVHKNDDTIPCLNQRVSCLWDKTKVQDYAEEILKLPPVIPAEKVGRWIDDNKDEIDAQYGRHLYRCQICNKYAEYFVGGTEDWWDIEKPNYCPECGAKMQEVKNDKRRNC